MVNPKYQAWRKRYEAGEDSNQIAATAGNSPSAVRRGIKAAGGTMRGNAAVARREHPVEEWAAEYAKKRGYADIAAEYGVSKYLVRARLIAMGVEPRKQGGSSKARPKLRMKKQGSGPLPPLGADLRTRFVDRKHMAQLVWIAFGENDRVKTALYKGRVHLGAARMTEGQFMDLLRVGWAEWAATTNEEDWIELTEEGRRARESWNTK